MALSDVSLVCKIAVGVAVMAVLFDVVSLSTNNWSGFTGVSNSGLWSVCSKDICVAVPGTFVGSAFKATRAFILLGFFAGIGCIVSLNLFIFKTHNRMVRLIALISSILAVFFTMIGIGLYAGQILQPSYVLGYSFYLNGLCIVLYIGVLVCIILDIVKNPVQA